MSKLTGYTKVAVIEQGDSWSGIKDYYYALYDDGVIYQPGDSVLVSGGARNSVWEIKEIISPEGYLRCDMNQNHDHRSHDGR